MPAFMLMNFLLLAFLDVGGAELMLIMILILVLFGGKRLPELARGLGKSIRQFKQATAGVEDQLKRALADEPEPQILPPNKKPSPAGNIAAGAAATGASESESAASPASEPSEPVNHTHADYDYEDLDPYAEEHRPIEKTEAPKRPPPPTPDAADSSSDGGMI